MKKYIICFILIALVTINVDARRRPGSMGAVEFGFGLGASSFLGDLGGSRDIGRGFIVDWDLRAFKPSISTLLRWQVSYGISLRMNLIYAQVSGNDAFGGAQSPGEGPGWHRTYRNLSFRSHILELSTVAEYNLFPYEVGSMKRRFTPFVFAGAGIFHFDPKANLDGVWHRLQPLGTEGQGLPQYPEKEKYNLIEYTFPVGGGIKYNISRSWSFLFEMGHRQTTTDYIDDVSTTYPDKSFYRGFYGNEDGNLAVALSDRSDQTHPHKTMAGVQRGDPSDNDAYTFTGIFTFVYVIKGGIGPYYCPSWKRKLNRKKPFRRWR